MAIEKNQDLYDCRNHENDPNDDDDDEDDKGQGPH